MWRYSETYQCLWLCIFSKNSLWHCDTVIRQGRWNCSATRNRTTACLLNLKTFIIRLKQDIHKWLDSFWFESWKNNIDLNSFLCAHTFLSGCEFHSTFSESLAHYKSCKLHLQWVWFWTLPSLCPPVQRTPWQPNWQSVRRKSEVKVAVKKDWEMKHEVFYFSFRATLWDLLFFVQAKALW